MRISAWSSDVCSSDLDQEVVLALEEELRGLAGHVGERLVDAAGLVRVLEIGVLLGVAVRNLVREHVQAHQRIERAGRSEERRAGKESVSTSRSRWWTYR